MICFLFLFAVICVAVPAAAEPLTDESATAKAVVVTVTVLALHELLTRRGYKGRVAGSKTRRRNRGKIREIIDEYGPFLFKRAFRMHEPSFWKLLDLIEPKLGKKGSGKRKFGKTPNGTIPNSLRLAIAIRYFAGGDPLDLAIVYHVTPCLVYQCVWEVVDAINQTKELDITFPSTYKEQEAVANEFKTRSSAGFNNCAGCVDGILIWIHKPSKPALQEMGIGGKKFFVEEKKIWTEHASCL